MRRETIRRVEDSAINRATTSMTRASDLNPVASSVLSSTRTGLGCGMFGITPFGEFEFCGGVYQIPTEIEGA